MLQPNYPDHLLMISLLCKAVIIKIITSVSQQFSRSVWTSSWASRSSWTAPRGRGTGSPRPARPPPPHCGLDPAVEHCLCTDMDVMNLMTSASSDTCLLIEQLAVAQSSLVRGPVEAVATRLVRVWVVGKVSKLVVPRVEIFRQRVMRPARVD